MQFDLVQLLKDALLTQGKFPLLAVRFEHEVGFEKPTELVYFILFLKKKIQILNPFF